MKRDPIESGIRGRLLTVWLAMVLLMVARASATDLIVSWNNAVLDSIRTDDTPPCLAARSLAIVHGAIYDAGVAASAAGQPFFFRASHQSNTLVEAAMNAAALAAASFAHPSQSGRFDELYQRLSLSYKTNPEASAGELLGRKVAQAWIEWRTSDGMSKSLPYIPRSEPGAWRRTPPFFRPPDLPAWCLVQPFALVGAAQFRPPGPPALSSPAYAQDFEATRIFGGSTSTNRTSEQTEIARFWSDFSYSVTPPGHWNQVAQEVTTARGLDLAAQARVFALLNITMADVGIACWEAKYHYNFWRPVTAIRAGDKDDNSATQKDAQWNSLLVTPSFPEYVSGHSAFSGAAAVILGSVLGTDAVHFTVPSDTLAGKTRSFDSLRACAEEISQSRMFGGIHFPSALRDGLAMGESIARYVLKTCSSPVNSVQNVFSAPREMESGFWVGGKALPGQLATVERFANGEWQTWTNFLASAPVIRWKEASAPTEGLRIVFR